jgi:hypothetical protein
MEVSPFHPLSNSLPSKGEDKAYALQPNIHGHPKADSNQFTKSNSFQFSLIFLPD